MTQLELGQETPEPPELLPARTPHHFQGVDQFTIEQQVDKCQCGETLGIRERITPQKWIAIFRLSKQEHDLDCIIRHPTRANIEAAILNAFVENDLR